MTRVLVHAGFHKTGTTSLQTYLHENEEIFSPYFSFYGKADFLQAGANARMYGQRPFLWRRIAFRLSLRAFLESVPDQPAIVLSRETFTGAMPGHRKYDRNIVTDYVGAGVPLCKEIVKELRRRFGKDVEIAFLFTVRERESWIRSVYGHLLRSIHLTDDFQTFRGRFEDLMDPEEEARRFAKVLAPVPVHIARLEDFALSEIGPAEAVLELMQVPVTVTGNLATARVHNSGQDALVEAQFLELNRQGIPKTRLKEIKDEILRANGTVTSK